MNTHPAVTVIMNCHNSARYLREAIDSVYAQTFKDWEIVFWDNASTDESAAIAKSYDAKLRYFYSDSKVSLGKARNYALQKASGKYIAFLDCDDVWLPGKLEKQVSIMRDKPGTGFIYTNYFNFDVKKNSKTLFLDHPQPEGNVFTSFLSFYPVGILTVMLSREHLDKLGKEPFDETLTWSEEYDVFMRMLYNTPAAYIHEPLALYRLHPHMSTVTMNMESRMNEICYVLSKLRQLLPNFDAIYAPQLKSIMATVDYCYSIEYMSRGNFKQARKHLKPHLTSGNKYILRYFATHLPVWLWKALHSFYRSIFMKLIVLALLLSAATAFADVPNQITYQGRLNEYGQATTGNKTMCFSIYQTATNGTPIWSSGDVSITVKNGLFSYHLIPTLDFSAGEYWLETTVSGKKLSPREKITSQFYALHSATAEDMKAPSGARIDFTVGATNCANITSSSMSVNGSFLATGNAMIQGKLGIGTTPQYTIDSSGSIRISSGLLIFPDGSSMGSADIGSAGSLSNNSDTFITSDADANGSGSIRFNVGSNEKMAVSNASITMTTTTINGKLTANNGILTGGKHLELIYSYYADIPTDHINVTGLNGNVDGEYIIELKIVSNSSLNSTLYLRPNNNSSSDYILQECGAKWDSTFLSEKWTTQDGFWMANMASSGYMSFSRSVLMARAGTHRLMLMEGGGSYNITTKSFYMTAVYLQSWSNSSDNITSLYFYSSNPDGIGTGSTIDIWARR